MDYSVSLKKNDFGWNTLNTSQILSQSRVKLDFEQNQFILMSKANPAQKDIILDGDKINFRCYLSRQTRLTIKTSSLIIGEDSYLMLTKKKRKKKGK